jgi:hypothetical protein
MAARRTTQKKSGSWFTRLFAGWWRARMYWKLGKVVLNAVRSLFSKRKVSPARR